MKDLKQRDLHIVSIVFHTSEEVTDVVCDVAARQATSMIKAPPGFEGRLAFHAEPCAEGVLVTPISLDCLLPA